MLWWMLVTPAGALQQSVDRAELCSLADLVVLAVPTAVRTEVLRWEHGLPHLERRVSATVQRTLLGQASPTLELRLPGGRLGELVHRVEDVPDLVLATPTLLFLKTEGASHRVVGGEQGARPLPLPDDEDPTTVLLDPCRAD